MTRGSKESAPALVESAGAVASPKGIRFSKLNLTPAWDTCNMTRRYLGIGEVAEHTGLARNTLKAYAAGGQLPDADVMIGTVRGWSVKTIDTWMANRPGQGARTDLARSKSRRSAA